MPGTEEDISNFIDDNFGTKEPDAGADTGTDDNAGGAPFQSDNAPVDKTVAPKDGAAQTAQPKTQPNTQTGQQPKTEQVADPATLRPLRNGVFADSKGNITDGQGKIVARAGAEARLYSNLATTRSELAQSQAKIRELEERGTTATALNGLPAKLGLSNDDVTFALDLAAKVRRGNAVDAVKDVLAILTAQGHNVTDLLGGDVGDSIEMRGIKRMMDERFKPIDDQRQQSQQQQEATARATTAYNTFLDNNEYAELHADDIALVMREEGLTAQQSYNKLMSFAARMQLDPAQPFEPQLRARQTQQPQQQQQRQQPTPKPMINGARGGHGNDVTQTPMASADDSWADIIKQAQATM